MTNVRDTYYVLGSRHRARTRIPMMVRDFQRVIGEEARAQIRAAQRPAARRAGRLRRRRLERHRASSIRSSTTAAVRLVGVEAAGDGVASGAHARDDERAARSACCTARRRYLLQDDDGQIADGALDLGGPRLSRRRPRARATSRTRAASSTSSVTDDEALEAFQPLARLEGIMPALETAHAVADAVRAAARTDAGPRRSWSASPGAATRTCRRSASCARAMVRSARDAASRVLRARCAARGERALVPYLTAGDPVLDATARLVPEAARGADVVELGVPFSDPIADGPVIQRAGAARPRRRRDAAARARDRRAAARRDGRCRSCCSATTTRSSVTASRPSPRRAAARASTACSSSTCRPRRAGPLRAAAAAAGLDRIFLRRAHLDPGARAHDRTEQPARSSTWCRSPA